MSAAPTVSKDHADDADALSRFEAARIALREEFEGWRTAMRTLELSWQRLTGSGASGASV